MKLKKKIITTCVLIALLPLILGLLIGGVIVFRQFDKINEAYGINEKRFTVIQNPMIAYNSIIKKNVERVKNGIEENTEKLEDTEYLDELNNNLSEHHTTLFVRQNGKYIYKGKKGILEYLDIYFPEYGNGPGNPGSIYINSESFSVLMEQMDFQGDDGDRFSVYLVMEVDKILPEIRNGATQIMLAIILILVLLGIVTLIWLYRLFINPLTKLSRATHQIMEGNLDFSIKTNRKDEIGQLQNDFEDMRLHLKESTEQQLYNADASKEMMSNISHDLKTPLTAIKGYAEGLLDGVADTPEKRQKYYKTIYAKACSMEELVEDLAYFSKLDNKMLTYNFTVISLKDFLKDCIEDVEMDLELRGIRLKESYQHCCDVNVIIDPDEIKRVIINIIGNSIKYMDKSEGCVSIRVLSDDDFAWISIEDNGMGVDAKDIPHIFERFYRADTSRGTKTGGTGLGLAIAKSIIEAHGGTISANSVKGAGTTVRFSLPRERTKEGAE